MHALRVKTGSNYTPVMACTASGPTNLPYLPSDDHVMPRIKPAFCVAQLPHSYTGHCCWCPSLCVPLLLWMRVRAQPDVLHTRLMYPAMQVYGHKLAS